MFTSAVFNAYSEIQDSFWGVLWGINYLDLFKGKETVKYFVSMYLSEI